MLAEKKPLSTAAAPLETGTFLGYMTSSSTSQTMGVQSRIQLRKRRGTVMAHHAFTRGSR